MASATVPRVPVEMVVRGPLPILLEDPNGEGAASSPGCYVLDLTFPQPSQVAEVFFHNFYTAWLSVMVRAQSPSVSDGVAGPSSSVCAITSSAARDSQWQMAIVRRNLMPNPHLETGSHDFVSILATESSVPWTDLVGMRLLLRQPSPSWMTFHVEEIRVFSEPPRRRKTAFQDNLHLNSMLINSPSSYLENESSIQSLKRNTQAALRAALPATQQQQTQQQPQPQPPPTPSFSGSGAQSNHPKPRLREMAALYEIANLLPT